MSTTLAARRLALCALFLLPGLAMSSWVTRTPAIRDYLVPRIADVLTKTS